MNKELKFFTNFDIKEEDVTQKDIDFVDNELILELKFLYDDH